MNTWCLLQSVTKISRLCILRNKLCGWCFLFVSILDLGILNNSMNYISIVEHVDFPNDNIASMLSFFVGKLLIPIFQCPQSFRQRNGQRRYYSSLLGRQCAISIRHLQAVSGSVHQYSWAVHLLQRTENQVLAADNGYVPLVGVLGHD